MEDKFLKDNLIARWLDDRLDPDEKRALEESGELDALQAVIDDVDQWKVEKFNTRAGYENLQKRKKQHLTAQLGKEKTVQKRTWLNIAATLLVLISASYFSWKYFSNPTTTITTSIAEHQIVDLPDGSAVHIDAASSLSYQHKNWEENRTVNLNGQAFFKVVKGSNFKVITDQGSVEVLGTQFNVITTTTNFTVACYEGKVAVNYKDQQEILTAGQEVTLKEQNLVPLTHVLNTPPWINGYSRYEKVNLITIAGDLERYYDTKIELPYKYQKLQFTGTLTHKDFNAALETLFTTMEIDYTINDDNSVTFK